MDFFKKAKCDRCGGSLEGGRIMSMFNEDCLCMACKEEETKREGYKEACDKDYEEYIKRNNLRHVCCICGKEFISYGNNPYPLKETGGCWDECNTKVIIERIKKSST